MKTLMDPKIYFVVVIPISIILLGVIYAIFVQPILVHSIVTPIVDEDESDGTIKLEKIKGTIEITYSTKGSFIVNNPIDVKASIRYNEGAEDIRKKFYLRNLGALNVNRPSDRHWSGAKILLEYNESIKQWEGKGRVRYTIPGNFEYIISNEDFTDKIRPSKRPEDLIYIASSDVSLQIRMNRWIMFLAFLSIGLTWMTVSEQIYKLLKKE